jgi:hypothetical protein
MPIGQSSVQLASSATALTPLACNQMPYHNYILAQISRFGGGRALEGHQDRPACAPSAALSLLTRSLMNIYCLAIVMANDYPRGIFRPP